MTTIKIPHPIPYQGSKRKLANNILYYLKDLEIDNFIEPFSGSAAVTLAAASNNLAKYYKINDSLESLSGIWDLIINNPSLLAESYENIWNGHMVNGSDHYYNIRAEFNEDKEPAKLLYLLARCVKNAVRFNSNGDFNQSSDKRRLGTKPQTMKNQIFKASSVLSGKASSTHGDYTRLLHTATPQDLIYMDPPWQGTSTKKDNRYHQILDREKLYKELALLNDKNIPYLLSFDGKCGNKTYGDPLPDELKLHLIELHAGRSSQSTLSGGKDLTIESLYLSPELVRRLESDLDMAI